MTKHSFRVNYQAAQLGNGRIKSRIGKGSIEHRELETREDPITAIASMSTSAKSCYLARRFRAFDAGNEAKCTSL